MKVGELRDREIRWITSPLALSSKRAKRLKKGINRIRTVVFISI